MWREWATTRTAVSAEEGRPGGAQADMHPQVLTAQQVRVRSNLCAVPGRPTVSHTMSYSFTALPQDLAQLEQREEYKFMHSTVLSEYLCSRNCSWHLGYLREGRRLGFLRLVSLAF